MSGKETSDGNNTGQPTDDGLSSFTNLGADGLDTDTMNLFGSFAHNNAAGGLNDLGDTGFGGFTNDLSSFGVDLGALDMGVDLSSIQLLNLDAPANNTDAADMVARLLASSTQPPPQSLQTLQPQQSGAGDALGLAAVQGDRSRASSQSSDDMGDIPLAQLALMQPASEPTAFAAAAPAQQSPLPPVSLPVPLPVPPVLQGIEAPQALDSTPIGAQPLATHPAPPSAVAPAEQSGTRGVLSTVLPHTETDTRAYSVGPPPQHLLPSARAPPQPCDALEALDALDQKLCSLLTLASLAVRILSGSGDPAAGESQLKPTVRRFMATVAEVQADLRVRHRELAVRRIPVSVAAGLHCDVAGGEQDLALWSSAARLLADAVETGLSISRGGTKNDLETQLQ